MIKNLVLGGLAGLMLSCVYVSLRYTLDDRIRDASRMLKDTYSFPVLAVIPELSAESKGYYYNSYTRKSIHDEQKED
jgi:capsular polysaccharide biosynthesis protein